MADLIRPGRLWFIVGHHGFYVSGFRTRRDAIIEHVNAIDEACFREQKRYSPLTENQKRAWKQCQRNGDRAVRCIVTPEAE